MNARDVFRVTGGIAFDDRGEHKLVGVPGICVVRRWFG